MKLTISLDGGFALNHDWLRTSACWYISLLYLTGWHDNSNHSQNVFSLIFTLQVCVFKHVLYLRLVLLAQEVSVLYIQFNYTTRVDVVHVYYILKRYIDAFYL